MNNNQDIPVTAGPTPPEQTGLKWLFLDLNSYFASVEQQEQPALRGKPVAVVPMETGSTCAIAASYEAKAYGIKTGTKIYEAKKLCPQLHCVLARHNIYVEYHHRILEAINRCVPVHRIWSIDECDCLLLGRERKPENAKALARAIKESIWKHVGPAINCSIGIAPNSFLAKVGTEMQKPNGLVLLAPEDLPGPLLDLKLTDLPGINVSMERRLYAAGITSVEELWNTSPKQARAIWKNVQGERFWYWLHGYEVPVPQTSPSMVGHSRVLDPALRSPDKTRQMTRRLLMKACTRLRKKDLYARRLSLSLRLVSGERWADECSFPAAHDPFTFLQHLHDLWQMMLQDCAALNVPLRFKKTSIVLHGLKTAEEVTGDLFEQPSVTEHHESLTRAFDHLHQKYHKETVWLGVVPKTLAGHVGTKIAFSRVPEKEEFWY